MRRFAKPRPLSQKRLLDRRSNLDPIYESEYQRRYDEIRLSLKVRKGASKAQSRKRRRSSGAYAIILTKTLLNEKSANKIHIETERIDEASTDSAYIDFLKMIGAFDARSRLMKTGPFSKAKPKPLPSVGRDFPELHSLLENLPKTRSAFVTPSSSLPTDFTLVGMNTYRAHNENISEDNSPITEGSKRPRFSIEIEEYPALTISESDDIVDLTAGVDLLTFPKSMSSMAASMYS